MDDPLDTLKFHINSNQVNNVVKNIKKKLETQKEFKWVNNDAFLRNAVIHQMKKEGYNISFQNRTILFMK
jgi:hypothetical protein